MKLALLGAGRMGTAIGLRLIDQGHSLVVWNRTPGKTAALVAAGALAIEHASNAAAEGDVIFSVLTDASAIESAYDGPRGALSAAVTGKLFIDMSTVRPTTQIALAERVARAGAALVECPVGGTVGPARDGKLLGLAGGTDADFNHAKPLLESLCRRLEHVGPIGAGASMKLAINLPLLVYWQALGEALSLAAPAGMTPARLMDILSDTSGAPSILKLRAPVVAKALEGENPGAAHFDIDSIRKDLRTMLEEAGALGYPLPTAKAALSVFDQASASGLGSGDGTQLAQWWLSHGKAA